MPDQKKYKVFSGVLYPDSQSYDCDSALAELPRRFSEWAYILHDRDTLDDGSPKKAHIHWVGRGDARSVSAVAHFLGVRENDIEIGKNFTALLQYLIHQNDPDKAQYDPLEVSHNVRGIERYFRRTPEGQIVADLCITKRHCSWFDLVIYASDCGNYDVLRRNLGIIKLIAEEFKDLSG